MASAKLTGGAKGHLGLEFLGTGGGLYADASGTLGAEAHSGSSHGTKESGSQAQDNRHNKNAQLVADFKSSMDVVASEKITTSGSTTDGNTQSQLDNFGHSLNKMKNDFENYTRASTRASEYAELASMTKDTSAQMESNYDQMFADWVTKTSPGNAHDILTNTSSPDIARQREALAQQFIEQELAPRIAEDYHANRRQAGSGMGGMIAAPAGRVGAQDSYEHGKKDLENQAANRGFTQNVGQDVDNQRRKIAANIHNDQIELSEKRSNNQQESDNLKNEHRQAEQTHQGKFDKERVAQGEKPVYEDVSRDAQKHHKNDKDNKDAPETIKGGD